MYYLKQKLVKALITGIIFFNCVNISLSIDQYIYYKTEQLGGTHGREKIFYIPEIVSSLKVEVRFYQLNYPRTQLTTSFIDPNGQSMLFVDIIDDKVPGIKVTRQKLKFIEFIINNPTPGYWKMKTRAEDEFQVDFSTICSFKLIIDPQIPSEFSVGNTMEYNLSVGDGTSFLSMEELTINPVITIKDTGLQDTLIMKSVHTQMKSLSFRHLPAGSYTLSIGASHKSGIQLPMYEKSFVVKGKPTADIQIMEKKIDFGIINSLEAYRKERITVRNLSNETMTIKASIELPRNIQGEVIDSSWIQLLPTERVVVAKQTGEFRLSLIFHYSDEQGLPPFGFFNGYFIVNDVPFTKRAQIPISLVIKEPTIFINPDKISVDFFEIPKKSFKESFEITSDSMIPTNIKLILPQKIPNDVSLDYQINNAPDTFLEKKVTILKPAKFEVEIKLSPKIDTDQELIIPVKFQTSTNKLLVSSIVVRFPLLNKTRLSKIFMMSIYGALGLVLVVFLYVLISPSHWTRSVQNKFFGIVGDKTLSEGWHGQFFFFILRCLEKVYPNSSVLLTKIGNAYFYQQDMEKAKEYYERSLDIDYTSWVPNYQLAGLKDEEGDHLQAVELYQKALRKNPREPKIYNNMGVAYFHALQNVHVEFEGIDSEAQLDKLKNEYAQESMKAFNKAIKLKPNYAEAFFNLGMLHYYLGDLSNAIAMFEKSISIKSQPHVQLQLAHALFENGDLVSAGNVYLKIKNKFEDDALLHNNLGEIYLSNDKEKEAIAEFQKAVQLDVSAVNALMKLGDIYLKKQFLEGAMEMYKQALQVNPDDPILIEKFNSLARYRRESDSSNNKNN